MKKSILFSLSFFMLVACTKQESRNNTESSPVEVKWDWHKTFNPRGPIIETPQNTGRSGRLTLRSDSTFTMAGSYFGGGLAGRYRLRVSTGFPDIMGAGTYISLDVAGEVLPREYKYTYTSADSLEINCGTPADNPILYFARLK